MRGVLGLSLLVGAMIAASAAHAVIQDQDSGGSVAKEARGDSDIVQTVSLASADEVVDVDAIQLPSLTFTSDEKFEKDFDKYYYFHRLDTDFKAAYSDLRACDDLSRGLASPFGNMDAPYPYNATLAGAAGGAIANVMVAAIFGSAQVRATRRINMRRCMHYKGYDRYGLPKEIWQDFNFEEGFSELDEDKRQAFLKQQAKVASGQRPTTGALGK
jgi:hypothetical protein